MIRVAIVGHEAAKFTKATEATARDIIRRCIRYYAQQGGGMPTVVSGACPLGGIDVWAVEEAKLLGAPYREYPPKSNRWETGFKPRNLQIAGDCDVCLCVVVQELPAEYQGMRFKGCYHCKDARRHHIKSGGCWTTIRALELGANVYWAII